MDYSAETEALMQSLSVVSRLAQVTVYGCTYPVTRAAFMLAAKHAAQAVTDANGQAWLLDGSTSRKIFLRLPATSPESYPGDIEVEFDLIETNGLVAYAG